MHFSVLAIEENASVYTAAIRCECMRNTASMPLSFAVACAFALLHVLQLLESLFEVAVDGPVI